MKQLSLIWLKKQYLWVAREVKTGEIVALQVTRGWEPLVPIQKDG
ncbi:MAG: hypothetical protein ACP5IT_06570 [Thermoproteota archaeon]|jgi:hypothetical protein